MARNRASYTFKVIWLPVDKKGKPTSNACRHLAEYDDKGRFVRFHRQTRRKLLLAEEPEAALRERQEARRVRRFIKSMKAAGFYAQR